MVRNRTIILPLLLVAASVVALGQRSSRAVAQEPSPAEGPPAKSPAAVANQSGTDDKSADAESAKKDAANGGILDLSIEQLRRTRVAPALEMEVTSVLRQPSTVGKSPAAIFVVTPEMIRRSGAQSIPEALRMVPGLQVARRDGNKWVVASRGVGGLFTKNLLVQIDGRTLYTPVFAGTYWDVQDVVLEDILRIEVIRGPGATLWGPNAVNGIINIITKSAKDTTGIYAKAGGGTEEDGFGTVRVGGCRGDLAVRGYFKWFDRGPEFALGGPAHDDWRKKQGGFRADWTPNCQDTMTLQGDVYAGTSGTTFIGFTPIESIVEGHNVLARWTRAIDDDRNRSIQVYYDTTDRVDQVLSQHVELFDVDFHSRFPLGPRNSIIWGMGYRRVKDFLPSIPPPVISFSPVSAVKNLYTCFVQDEITLREDTLFLTLGTKLEKNDFTGFEVQPNIRLLWTIDEKRVLWGSVSRAVRTPSRFSQDSINVTRSAAGPSIFGPSPGFKSEELIAYELGYRAQPVEEFSWDASLFYNVYEGLESWDVTGVSPPYTLFSLVNGMHGSGYGIELSCVYQASKCWKISAWYSYLRLTLEEGPTLVPRVERIAGSSPLNQAFLMSSWDLGYNVDFDLMARYVDRLPAQSTPAYMSLDLRLAWQPAHNMELSIVGQNLLDPWHLEFGNVGGRPDPLIGIRRGVFGYFEWRR